mmetsp:Transcript_17293/g.46948  ORF Transcript_17293/g.46948 Transcript_17293/m.46948 type:complete len:326 (-) Transcript_17293:16-993(-)
MPTRLIPSALALTAACHNLPYVVQASRHERLLADHSVLGPLERLQSRVSRVQGTAREAFLQLRSSRPPLTIGILTSPDIAFYADSSVENWRAYTARHGYKLEVITGGTKEACGSETWERLESFTARYANIWGKVCLLRNLLSEKTTGEVEDGGSSYVLVVDADTFMQQPTFSIMDELVNGLLASNSEASGLMFDDRKDLADYPGCWNSDITMNGLCRPNSFFMLFRKNAESLDFARGWLEDALGDCMDLAKSFPPTQTVLWNCTLPKTQTRHGGFLHVHNGMKSIYTLSPDDSQMPLVHFQDAKYNDMDAVKSAIARTIQFLSIA